MLSNLYLLAVLCLLFGYLCGSIITAVLVAKCFGLPDPRTQGSKNPGATNVLRSGHKTAAIMTLLGDALKAFLPMLVVRYSLNLPFNQLELLVALTGLGAFLGHLYPVFFGFKGGKGVATGLGVLAGLNLIVFLLAIATWLLVALLFRYSSLGALTAFLLAPLYTWWQLDSITIVYIVIGIAILIFWRHRSNIRDLLSGKEEKIGQVKGD